MTNHVRRIANLAAAVALFSALSPAISFAQQYRVPSESTQQAPQAPVARLRLAAQNKGKPSTLSEPRLVQNNNPFPETPPQPRRPGRVPDAPERDPTTVSPEIRPLLDPTKGDDDEDDPIEVQLRGRISMSSQPTIGILRVGDSMHLIQEGTRISVGNPPKSLVVKKLTATSAEVELEYQNNRIIDLQ